MRRPILTPVSSLTETRGINFELVRHFLASMFDSEMFSARGQSKSVAIAAFSLAAPAGMLLLDPPYIPHRTVPSGAADELAVLTLLFAITGVLALLAWQSLFPARRDFLALASFPATPWQIFVARFVSILLFATTLVVTISILPSLMPPHYFTAPPFQAGDHAGVTARGIPAVLGCFFIFFAIVALQGVLLNALPARRFTQVSTYVQGALVAIFFLAGLYSWSIVKWSPEMMARLPEFAWAPPVWFAGLHQVLSGNRDPFNAAMAERALVAAAGALALSAATYLLSYRRYRKLLLESSGASHYTTWSLEFGNPRQAAIRRFIVTTLSRSRTHRLVWMVYAGAALGIIVNGVLLAGAAIGWRAGLQGTLQFAALYWPLETSFIMLSGMRHVFSLPADLPSNWIFQITESQGRRDWMRAVEQFAIVYIIVPIYVISTPIAASALGWPVALRMTVLQAVVSLITFDLLFYEWQQLPFACSYVPGKKSLMSLVASWIAVLGVITPFLSIVISTVARMWELFLIYGAFFVGDWIWARRRRLEGWGESHLIYQDLFGEVLSLGIKDMTYRSTVMSEESQRHDPPEFPEQQNALMRRLKLVFHRGQLDQDLDDELQFHLAMSSPRQFGNLALVKEDCRNQWIFPSVETFWQDLRYGARQLRRAPAVTVVAALTLALGLGATTAVYSMCEAVLWRPVALPHAESLAMVLQALPADPHLWSTASPADLADIRSATTTLEAMTSWSYGMANIVTAGGEPIRLEQVRVRPNFFDVLSVQPAMGHGFQANDREVILSDGCWRRRFGADPAILGKSIWLDDRKFTVIGVMPPAFAFPRVSKELWTPLKLTPQEEHSRDALMLDSIARLKPGRSLKEAGAELDTIARRLEAAYPDTNKKRRFLAWPVQRFWTSDYSLQFSRMLFGAAGFVLLICCANVANLQLARSTSRGRELAVRAALGAGRIRVIRQLLTESLLLAVLGAVIGLVVSDWALHIIKAGVPGEMRQYMPGWADIGLNPRALLFALGATLLSGIIAGLAPALRSSRQDLTGSLKDGGIAASSGRGRRRVRGVLVVAEIALATVLVLGAGLMVRSFGAVLNTGARMEPATLLTLHLSPANAQFYSEVLERIGAIPGVRSVAAVTALPHSRRSVVRSFDIEERSQRGPVQAVTATYFETLHIPLQSGRLVKPADGPDAPRVAVISQSAATRWWPGEASPLGKHITMESQTWTIVGIVDDVDPDTPQPVLYIPYLQSHNLEMDIAVRTALAPMRLAPDLRSAIRAIDSRQPITNLNTMQELIHQEAFGLVYIAALMGTFGALALGLSFVGVYGLMNCLVSEQVREIGVRMALGANPRNIIGLFCRDGLRKAATGLAIGFVLAVGLERVMRAVMLGVKEDTPLVLLCLPLVLAAAVAIAVYIPARKATRVDPVDALRC